MRAAVLDHYGEGAPSVRDFPDPVPAPGEALVRLRAAALNRVDLYMRGGGQGITHTLPLVLGLDGAGEVVSAPPDSGLAPGDRVLLYPAAFCGRCPECQRGEQPFCERVRIAGEHRHGTFAELVAMPAACWLPIPAGLGFEEAAALPVAYLTAWRMLFGWDRPLRPRADGAGGGRGRRGGQRLRAARAPGRGAGAGHLLDAGEAGPRRRARRRGRRSTTGPRTCRSACWRRPAARGGPRGGQRRRRHLGPVAALRAPRRARGHLRRDHRRRPAGGAAARVHPADPDPGLDHGQPGGVPPPARRGGGRPAAARGRAGFALEEVPAALDHLAAGGQRGKLVLRIG